MTIRTSVVVLALVAAACGGKSSSDDNDGATSAENGSDEPGSGDKPTDTPADIQATDRPTVTTNVSEKMSANLVESGMAQAEVDAIMAAARAKTDALPADADQAAYFYAFAQGAAAALNETLIGNKKFEDPLLAGKAAAAVTRSLITLLYGNPAYALLPAEELAKIEKSILEGSIAGLFQIEIIEALKAKLEGGASLSLSSVGGIGGITAINIQTMDLETALMMVQSNRAQLLETQLKDQIASVQSRNDAIAEANKWLGQLNKEAAGNSCPGSDGVYKYNDGSTTIATLKTKYSFAIAFRADMTATEKCTVHSSLITQIKGLIDGMSNSQQMDMLRMQSLSNKRNEAFEVMTNFIKKMADSRSSILGNMRLTEDDADPVLKTGRAFDARMLATVASSFIKVTQNANFTEATLATLLGKFVAVIGKDNTAARLEEPLLILAEILAKDIAAMDSATAKTLIERAALGAISGAILAFDDQALAIQMNAPLARGMSQAIRSHKDTVALHEKMATGHMSALIAIAGKAEGTSENPHAGNDAVRIAVKQMLQALQTALASHPATFTAYLEAAKAAVQASELSGTSGYEVLWNPLMEVSP